MLTGACMVAAVAFAIVGVTPGGSAGLDSLALLIASICVYVPALPLAEMETIRQNNRRFWFHQEGRAGTVGSSPGIFPTLGSKSLSIYR